MEIKHYIVKKKKEGWTVIQFPRNFISVHSTRYDAWKEARRLARGAGGKATLREGVSNVYAHAEDDSV